MSLKRPLSPESSNNLINNDIRQLKRLKLHSIIQELRNEEANLVILKKLHTSQHISNRINNNSATITNGFHPTATRLIPLTTNSSSQQQTTPTATRKSSNSPLLVNSNKISTNHSVDQHKSQAKLALRKQLERDLLTIPLPKPFLQDILFIPNSTSLDFQLSVGLEDVIQCLNELQNDRHRLPQRFTDHAQIDQPYICDQCGTDFTIRWWRHPSNEIINILCDRCKKQVIRRTLKSQHSTLLKNVFISAMEQEKEIEKHFHKQQKNSSRLSSKSLATNNHPIQSKTTTSTYQTKNSSTQNVATKLSRKSNVIVQSQINQLTNTHGNHFRSVPHNKTSIPTLYHQQYRSTSVLPQQQTKNNQIMKMSKGSIRQQSALSSSHSMFPPNPKLMNLLLSSNLKRPTATKRRTFPTVEMK